MTNVFIMRYINLVSFRLLYIDCPSYMKLECILLLMRDQRPAKSLKMCPRESSMSPRHSWKKPNVEKKYRDSVCMKSLKGGRFASG